jgi:HAD superfamily hydrolase (TIGR01549 family)
VKLATVGADFDTIVHPLPAEVVPLATVEVVLVDFERTMVRLFEDFAVEREFLDEVRWECFRRHVSDSVLKAPESSPYSLWMKAYRSVAKRVDRMQAEMLHHAVSKIAKRYEMCAAESIQLFHGVPPVLERFKIAGIAVVIVSNNATDAVELVLERNDAKRLVDHVIGREYVHRMVGNLKPKPLLLLEALRRAEHDADAALLVGDSVDDMRAGRNARIRRRVAVLEHSTATTWQLRRAGARRILWSFGDLLDLPELRGVLRRVEAAGVC